MALKIIALGSALGWWEIAGYIATGLVLLGVVGESLVQFTKWIPANWESRAGNISALILVAGLACEILTQVMVNATSGQIIALLNNEAMALRYEISYAELKVDISSKLEEGLDRDVQSQKARAGRAVASLNAEEVSLERAVRAANARDSRLRKDLTKSENDLGQATKAADMALKKTEPRQLLFCSGWSVLAKLPKAKSVEILYEKTASDAFLLAVEIDDCLEQGGWPHSFPKPIPVVNDPNFRRPDIESLGASDSGVTVVVRRGPTVNFDEGTPESGVLKALMASLNGDGVSEGATDDVPEGGLRIVVGPRP
jgi:hypothetical protein